jgi:APA family basic amino acid/polyamine antiporter
LAVAAVYVLRRSQPHAERPYRTWGYPATPAIYLLFFGGALAAMLLNRPVQSIAGTGLIFIGLIYYEWAVRRLRGRGHVPQEWWHEEKGKQDAGPASP